MLVESTRKGPDRPFNLPADFVGLFPSSDTRIYIDAALRLGHAAGSISGVGFDDFGRSVLHRFARDGVDTSLVAVLPGRTTGVAFFAYFVGGGRKFSYHGWHAATGCLAPEHVHAGCLQAAKWLHLTGGNLAASPTAKVACYEAMKLLPRGVDRDQAGSDGRRCLTGSR
jgi:tagatose kinase